MMRSRLKDSLPLWGRGLVLGLLVVLALYLGAFQEVERWLLNEQFHLRGPIAPKSPIVIVSIDEDSFDELFLPWPWPRSVHAQLIQTLSQGKPAVIGMDVLFPEPSSFGEEDDLALGEAITDAGNVILAAALTSVRDDVGVRQDLNPPIPVIREGAAGFGPVNFVIDSDAVVRRVDLKPNLSQRELDHFVRLIYGRAVQAGIPAEPIDREQFIINYRGAPGSFVRVPYYRVLNGEIPPDVFAGQIVLIGATTPVLHDVFPTPFAQHNGMPGVEIQANTLETIMEGIAVQPIPKTLTAVLVLVASLFAVWFTNRLLHGASWVKPLQALGVVLGVAILYAGGGLVAFVSTQLWVQPTPVAAALLLGNAVVVVENFMRVQREKRRLSPFFSPAVLDEILRYRDDRAIGAARRKITVLFSDIRGFTKMSARLTPEEVATILQDYLTELTEVVFKHGGTVDKYVGDCIMALYNAPLEDPEHALKAVRTALDFQERTRALSERWEAMAGVELKNGVGIHTGEAVVGTMGSRQRLEYTAIGDTVNLAARLESLTKDVHSPIVISESTYREVVGRFRTRWLGEVTVKGRESLPTRIYGVLDTTEVDVRRDARVPVDRPITLAREGVAVSALASDLSRGGLAVRDLPVSTDAGLIERLRFELPPNGLTVETTGAVAWYAGDRAGFRFVDLKPELQAAIDEFIASRGA